MRRFDKATRNLYPEDFAETASYSTMARVLGQGCIVPPTQPTDGQDLKRLADDVSSHMAGRSFCASASGTLVGGEGWTVTAGNRYSDADFVAQGGNASHYRVYVKTPAPDALKGDGSVTLDLDAIAKTVETITPDEQWRKAVLDNADKQCEAIDNGYRCSTITDLEAIPLKPGTRRPEEGAALCPKHKDLAANG
jgi:hypothetical protein